MALLNGEAYTVKRDKLIYDSKHPIDATTVQVSVTSDKEGVIRRGQLLYCKDGVYSAKKADDNEASAISVETTSYSSDDTDIVVEAYISGTFRKSEIVTDSDISAADEEALRGKGIYLK
jgi:hypothetical protein